MGHIRVGRLPRTVQWQRVVRLLDEAPGNTSAVASTTVVAARRRLRELARDPSLIYCCWLLTRISAAARGPDFEAALNQLGLDPRQSDSSLAFIAQVGDRVREELARYPESGPFGELASLALRRALSETVGEEGRSLFGSSLEDLEFTFQRHASPARFGGLARRFFGDFLARSLRFFVEKELANHVGADHGLRDIDAGHAFANALDVYARESAHIMEEFAADWYDKHNWESEGQIGRDKVQGFVAGSLRKLRAELARSTS